MKEIQFLDSFGTFGIYNRKNKDDEKLLVTVCTWENINGSQWLTLSANFPNKMHYRCELNINRGKHF